MRPTLPEQAVHQPVASARPADAGISAQAPSAAALDAPVPLATIEQLLVEATIQCPEADALIGAFGSLSYADLLIRAQNIAVVLRRNGVVPGALVGVAMDQSPVCITAIVGVLLAGAAYVPLGQDLLSDPRVLQRIRGAGMKLVLCDGSSAVGHLDSCSYWRELGTVLDASRLEQETMPSSAETRMPAVSPDATAAVLFQRTLAPETRPDTREDAVGVMVSHRAIVRLVTSSRLVSFRAQETYLLHPADSTRTSFLELWGSLLHGAALALGNNVPSETEQLEQSVRQFAVSTLCLPVTAVHELIDHAPKAFVRLSNLVVEQDGKHAALSPQRLQWLSTTFPRLHIAHSYGTIETSGYATRYIAPSQYAAQASVPVGEPIDGMEAVILDRELFPAREGEIGELAFIGDGVASGYLHDPDATARRFFRRENKNAAGDSLLFLTGERARRRSDGLLELHGRSTESRVVTGLPPQVPTASARTAYSGVLEEVAAAEDATSASLATPSREEAAGNLESITLHAPEAPELPIAAPLPLRAQPERDPLSAARDEQLQHEVMEQVRAIWLRLLQRTSVGYDEDFFDAGGTPVQMIRMHVELNRRFPGAITMANLSVLTTIHRICEHLVRLEKEQSALAQRGA